MLFIKNLKPTILAVIILFTTGALKAQNKEQEKTDKKKVREEKLAENLKAINSAVDDSVFVLEANMIRGRYTSNNFVSPNTNFIKVEGDEIVVQTADAFNAGYNGLGGITVRGNIREYEVRKDDGGVNVFIQMSSTVLGYSTVNISVNASGHASATVRTGFGGYANFDGDFRLLEDSGAFEGTSIL